MLSSAKKILHAKIIINSCYFNYQCIFFQIQWDREASFSESDQEMLRWLVQKLRDSIGHTEIGRSYSHSQKETRNLKLAFFVVLRKEKVLFFCSFSTLLNFDTVI